MKILNYYVESWRRFGDFRGRSSRPAYWWPFLLHPLVFFVLGGIFAAILDLDTDQIGPEIVYFIAYLWLSIALGVRRLHDMGRKGKQKRKRFEGSNLQGFPHFGFGFRLHFR